MDFGDISKKAEAFLEDDKVKNALKSEQAENVSDSLLDAVAGAAEKITDGKFHDQIDDVKNNVDKAVGDK